MLCRGKRLAIFSSISVDDDNDSDEGRFGVECDGAKLRDEALSSDFSSISLLLHSNSGDDVVGSAPKKTVSL